MNRLKIAWEFALRIFRDWVDPFSKLAQICAVVIGGFWAWHMHLITAENELRPEVNVCAQVVDKGKDGQGHSKQSRLIAIYITEKNVGKVPIELDESALKVTIKKFPETRSSGFINIDKQPISYENRDYLKRYGKDGTVIDPGVEYTDVELVDLPFGTYHIEAMIDLHDNDFTNGIAIFDVTADENSSSHCGAQKN